MLTLTLITILVTALSYAYAGSVSGPPSHNINNCSGHVPPRTGGYKPYFVGYTPQIHHRKGGWETWTHTLPGTQNESLIVFTWARGDPACPKSDPYGPGTFSIFASHTNFSATLKDTFVYRQVKHSFLDISIGDNHLVFDGTVGLYGSWNVSIRIDGFELDMHSDPVPPELPLTPYFNGINSQLVDGYFTNIPLTRGHTDGIMKYPTGQVWKIHDVTTIRHAWAREPIQDLVFSFTRGSAFFALDVIHWFQAESTCSEKVDSAQLVIGVNEATSDIPLRYQATNDPSVLTISSVDFNTTVKFVGCAASEDNPYMMTIYPVAHRGSFVDSAGGVLDYYSATADASIWTGQDLQVTHGSIGVIEVYTSPDSD